MAGRTAALRPAQVKPGEAASFANGLGIKLYAAYQERLKTLNAVDFGDLLLENIRLFREHHRNAAAISAPLPVHPGGRISGHQCRAVSVAAPAWAEHRPRQRDTRFTPAAEGEVPAGRMDRRALAVPGATGGRAPSCRRGTSAASATTISRSMAGAAPRSTTSCASSSDFPGAKVIRLERNYRSTGHILAAASHLIAHNEGRLGKTLRTEGEAGEKVTVTSAWDSEEEARLIGEEIEALQRGGHSLDEIAILVRASFQMREFEDRFVTLGLPYRVIGGPRFYERAEIRDALAYLRCINRRPTISPSSASSMCPSAASAMRPSSAARPCARRRRCR